MDKYVHIRLAEAILKNYEELSKLTPHGGRPNDEVFDRLLARAQVHATLAIALRAVNE